MSMIVHTGHSSSSTSSGLSMKLLVDRETQRVVYAEADKDAVDFLFSLLTLPIGMAINMDRRDPMVNCVRNLRGSFETLPDRYFCHADARATLLALLRPTAGRLLVTGGSSSSSNARSSTRRNGYVQGIVTYTVTDDLKITPMSTISGITMLNTFGIRDIRSLYEKIVRLGDTKGVQILRESQVSKRVLTHVFLRP